MDEEQVKGSIQHFVTWRFAAPSVPFSAPFNLFHHHLHHQGLERRGIPQQVLHRLHHVHADQFFLRIDPEIGAGITGPEELADGTLQRGRPRDAQFTAGVFLA